MLSKVKVRLQPIVSNINLPTVIKTTFFPGDANEYLMIATQTGEIFYAIDGMVGTFLDISSNIIKLGASGGPYDERGLIGMAFHPEFYYNGLFYLHYTAAGTQGPGALPAPVAGSQGKETLPEFFNPEPCNTETLNLKWTDREHRYDHIDTVEEWVLQPDGQPIRRRTLLNIRRPFFNHNGVNSLNFSPETGRLVLTVGDGGSGYDPFNLSQDDMEIAGKIIEIDVSMDTSFDDPPVVTRFDELPAPIMESLTVIAKGVRNITGISYQSTHDSYIKYVGIVGQDLVESVFSFVDYMPVPVIQLIEASANGPVSGQEGFINFGWRGWEGAFPTTIIRSCPGNAPMPEETIAYYDDALNVSVRRLPPLTCYYHMDRRPNKFGGTALTGVQAYLGNDIPDLTGSVVFTDLARDEEAAGPPTIGVLAYTRERNDCKLNDYSVIGIDYNFGSESAYFTCLGTNMDQTRLYLGAYASMNVTDLNQGTIYEIVM